jgi:hypothetical protein
MTQPERSVTRTLVEIQLSQPSGLIIADGRFVVETKDGIARLQESLRAYHPMEVYRIDLRLSELLSRTEREELEGLRATVRSLKAAAE